MWIRVGSWWVWVINGSTRKQHDKKCVISGSTHVTYNRHIWHANLFVSTQNNIFNTIRLTRITNKYSFYFRFVKYLLYSTYILNLKRKVGNYKKLIRDIIGNWNFTNLRSLNPTNPKSLNLLINIFFYFFISTVLLTLLSYRLTPNSQTQSIKPVIALSLSLSLMCLVSFRIKENHFLGVSKFCSNFFCIMFLFYKLWTHVPLWIYEIY